MKLVGHSKSDILFFINQNELKKTERPPKLISEYVDNKRILPPDSPFPGRVDLGLTEFSREIIDSLSPYSTTQRVAIMSAAQVVKTFIIENVILYYIGALPSPILFCSGTDALLQKWWTKRFEPAIDSMDLRKLFTSTISNAKTRQTGDTGHQKLFHGGFVERASAQSPSSMRADSVRLLCLDECDAAPVLLTTQEGKWWEVITARTKAWGPRRKILACSTPTEYHTSAIYEMYLHGDQCEYHVPCIHCGEFQLLEFGGENTSWGIKSIKENGIIVNVYYVCKHCGKQIYEYNKTDMIKNGKWVANGVPEPHHRSFHINALLSPYGGYSWMDLYFDYQKSKKSPDGERSFTNLQLGLPYIQEGTRPKAEKILENRGMYQSGYVPGGVLYITVGIDVQRGSKNDPENPPRIEMEVLGIGYGYRTWSIEYKVFKGDVKDPYSGAWETLHQYMCEREFQYTRKSDNFKFPIQLIFIDSGDGENTDVIYRFTGRWVSTYPIKGQKTVQRKKSGKPDEASDSDFHRYKASKINEDITIYLISTVYYKNQIYNNLSIKRNMEGDQKPGFCDFPIDYDKKYFDMLTAEEKMIDGSFEGHGRRNEALDCRVYALCAADVWLDNELRIYKEWAKSEGWSRIDIMNISHRNVIDNLIKSTGKKK